jgi:hypothetical protein
VTPATLSWGCGIGFPVPWATRNGPNESVGNAAILCGPPSGHGKMPSIAMMPPSSSIPMTAMARAEPFLGTARVSIRRTGAVTPATARLILDKGGLKTWVPQLPDGTSGPRWGRLPPPQRVCTYGEPLRLSPRSDRLDGRAIGISRTRPDEPRKCRVGRATWAHGPAQGLQPAQHILGAQIRLVLGPPGG